MGAEMSERIPAEAFPVGTFIAEELVARDWSVADLAARMPGDFIKNALAIQVMIVIDSPNLTLGGMAEKLALAFNTSAEFWRNLEGAYRAWHPDTKPIPARPDA